MNVIVTTVIVFIVILIILSMLLAAADKYDPIPYPDVRASTIYCWWLTAYGMLSFIIFIPVMMVAVLIAWLTSVTLRTTLFLAGLFMVLIFLIMLATIAYYHFITRPRESSTGSWKTRRRKSETTLRHYLEEMKELLRPPYNLRESDEASEVRALARNRTLDVLRSLDHLFGKHKDSVVQFLIEAELISTETGGISIISLADADLSGANLAGLNLAGQNLAAANLGANLTNANLAAANLAGAKLLGANLNGANLSDANLSDANLSGANLAGADLRGAWFDNATIWPDGFDPIKAGAKLVSDD